MPTQSSSSALTPGRASGSVASPSATPAVATAAGSDTATASGRHVDSSATADALPSGTEVQQGTARHRATGPVDTVQLLAASVDGSRQVTDGVPSGTTLGALEAPADANASLLATTAAAQRGTGSAGGPDTLLLLTTAGAALALAGTALETARRQRAAAAVARGRGRRARR